MKELDDCQDDKDLLDITTSSTQKSQQSMIGDLKFKHLHKKSLLTITPHVNQRQGSRSCIEHLSQINEERHETYTVYYFDSSIGVKHQICVQTQSCITVAEFIPLIIAEFNNQNQLLQTQLDDSMDYELYMAKKSGKPDEDSPAWANTVQLSQTNVKVFALKVTKQPIRVDMNKDMHVSNYMSSSACTVKLNWWQKITSICCFINEE